MCQEIKQVHYKFNITELPYFNYEISYKFIVDQSKHCLPSINHSVSCLCYLQFFPFSFFVCTRPPLTSLYFLFFLNNYSVFVCTSCTISVWFERINLKLELETDS